MSHTPGPWNRLILDYGHEWNKEGMIIGADPPGRYGNWICRIFHPDTPSDIVGMTSLAPPADEAAGNADLIAAAPELLKECCMLTATLMNLLSNPEAADIKEAIMMGNAVIGKAQGREQSA